MMRELHKCQFLDGWVYAQSGNGFVGDSPYWRCRARQSVGSFYRQTSSVEGIAEMPEGGLTVYLDASLPEKLPETVSLKIGGGNCILPAAAAREMVQTCNMHNVRWILED